jgi:hypothetical protein
MHTLAINRRFLYVGLFLVALGGVFVAVDLSAMDTTVLASALRLWPLALVAIGAGIALRRSRYALVAGVLAAMVPGLVLGGGLALGPRYPGDCGSADELVQTASQSGVLNEGAPVSVAMSCGSIEIGTVPGREWQLTAESNTGQPPILSGSANALEIESIGQEDWEWLDEGRDAWALSLPTTQLGRLDLAVNAGRATVSLPDANVELLSVTGNGAQIMIDATGATLADVSGTLNFGQMTLALPAQGNLSGAFRIAAGELLLCSQPGYGLRVDIIGSAREVRVGGLRYDERIWESESYTAAPYRADISVRVNFGTLAINPIGGCK